MTGEWCCKMRAHFVIGVVAVRSAEPLPVEAGEFIDDFTAEHPTIRTVYCPFCGSKIHGQKTNTTWTPFPPEAIE